LFFSSIYLINGSHHEKAVLYYFKNNKRQAFDLMEARIYLLKEPKASNL